MHKTHQLTSLILVFLLTGHMLAEETKTENSANSKSSVAPVRMGTGLMTFDTVPGWGLRPDGNSALGPTHGAVVVSRDGNVYTSAAAGVFVFSPDGKVVHSYLGKDYAQMHDMEIRLEGDREFIYAARNDAGEGLKFDAHTGEIVLRLPFPEESGTNQKKFKPTAITVAPDGEIFVSDGYASNRIFVFDQQGKYLRHFGKSGDGLKQFHIAHGMTLDTRYEPPRLLICDRNHQPPGRIDTDNRTPDTKGKKEPRGRLLHYSLDGEFIQVVISDLGMPTSVAIQGEFVSVADLHGRVVILDGNNTIMAVLGHNPDPAKRASFNVPQTEWIEGVFSGTHGSYWDSTGNLYVQDWNKAGRIMKLVRVDNN